MNHIADQPLIRGVVGSALAAERMGLLEDADLATDADTAIAAVQADQAVGHIADRFHVAPSVIEALKIVELINSGATSSSDVDDLTTNIDSTVGADNLLTF